MTVIQSLPRNYDGMIQIPIGAIDESGNEYPGFVDPIWLENATNPMQTYMDKTVPLSDSDYQTLLSASTPNWQKNWQRFRAQNVI